ncbi:MAG: glycosyltransferase family 4 protein [Gammaproteobacteria bacterium]|nr:glycosyltransferase family 4 protein [Gammaproteobacteria bacterium]NIR84026.1 glycosyltransferase family 4 protein [Gammaproteobacteria bacterium]NIR89170.1 glycosyltransferase family 4 protein [Gammaproteobacteria bacterium]NIU04972.1 glycosyltransferase family 4 protein [Gammaproteobacteria bacterium]NIV52138.1 glycosyltransferase [Gammaproteobacteria bacterium]
MISDVFFPRISGVSTSIATFRRQLARNGYRVTVIAPDYRNGAWSECQSVDDDVIRVPSRRLLFDPEDRVMSAGCILRLMGRIQGQPPDLVHIQTPFVAHYSGVRIARELNVPVVESYHAFVEEYFPFYAPMLPKALTRTATRYLWRRQCREVDGLVVPSRVMVEVLRSYGVRTSVEVIPTGIELERFATPDGARFRREQGIPEERPLLLYVGRLACEKNIDLLIRVTHQVRRHRSDALLVIAGRGPARPDLERLTGDLGLADNVRFVGGLEHDTRLPDCYAAADALMFASRTETQGLVLLEAMAFGLPVVSTSLMGTREALRAGEGALIVEEDEQAFARAVLDVLHDDALRRRLAERARSYARRWDAASLARRLGDFYRRVLRERGALDRAASA